MVLLFASLANAATIHGLVSNASQYGQRVVCVPEMSYAADFQRTLNSVNYNDSSDRAAAADLLHFFQSDGRGSCYNIPSDGQFSLDLPDSNQYLFLLVMSPDGAHVYWHVWNVDAQIEQIVTTDAPTF